jgi:uncharacterized protein YgbK (DUF1537 family)
MAIGSFWRENLTRAGQPKRSQKAWQGLARSPIDVLVVFGGDTAFAIVEAIGNPPLYPIGEVSEGIPISKIEAKHISLHIGQRARDLYVITKAGGFGPPGVLTSIRNSIAER